MILEGKDNPNQETIISQLEITKKAIELKTRELERLEERLSKLQELKDTN